MGGLRYSWIEAQLKCIQADFLREPLEKGGLGKIFLMQSDFCNKNNVLWDYSISVALDVAANSTQT